MTSVPSGVWADCALKLLAQSALEVSARSIWMYWSQINQKIGEIQFIACIWITNQQAENTTTRINLNHMHQCIQGNENITTINKLIVFSAQPAQAMDRLTFDVPTRNTTKVMAGLVSLLCICSRIIVVRMFCSFDLSSQQKKQMQWNHTWV